MWDRFRSFLRTLSAEGREEELRKHLEEARRRTPAPVIWLFGKTQSGKTSVVKFLTGAEDAEIGNGFEPCTRFSRYYAFPTSDTPLVSFLDTRGLDEPGYDPSEDLERFNESAHLVLVTAKVLDHAQENVVRHLEAIRKARVSRPVILALTCLHEAYPQQQHPTPYPFCETLDPPGIADSLRRSISEQDRTFGPLVDAVIPIDLTRPEEGFDDPKYGGNQLKKMIVGHLPETFRQTLLTLDRLTDELKQAHLRQALPIITGHSYLAAAAGAIPVPFVDLLMIPGIQMKMVSELANLYGQPMTGERFKELAATLGLGLVARQAVREVAKVIPFLGMAAGAALAGASTYALGRAFCFYYQAVKEGHVPPADELKGYFEKELTAAQQWWGTSSKPEQPPQ